jgi:hypothetical protein
VPRVEDEYRSAEDVSFCEALKKWGKEPLATQTGVE